MSKVLQYLKERAKWKKFGKPLRTSQEMEELFTICSGCDMFNKASPHNGICTQCECNISKINTYFNKLAWGTTRCPLDDPKWIESDTRYSQTIKITDEDLSSAKKDFNKELKNNLDNKTGGCCG